MNKGLPPLSYQANILSGPIPIMICLAYWDGDKDLAVKVANLMADLQPHHVGNACRVLLVCRQDSKMYPEIYNPLLKKFNVSYHISGSPLRGWPSGPNGMFGNTMLHLCNSAVATECVFWMETDCVPMRTNWFWDLVQLWRNRAPGANIIGCRCDCHGDGTGDHINGCAIYDPQIARIMPSIVSCDNIAWDYCNRQAIVRMGQSTNQIQLRYKATNVEPTILNDPCCVMHGVKDNSLIDLVREHRVPKPEMAIA